MFYYVYIKIREDKIVSDCVSTISCGDEVVSWDEIRGAARFRSFKFRYRLLCTFTPSNREMLSSPGSGRVMTRHPSRFRGGLNCTQQIQSRGDCKYECCYANVTCELNYGANGAKEDLASWLRTWRSSAAARPTLASRPLLPPSSARLTLRKAFDNLLYVLETLNTVREYLCWRGEFTRFGCGSRRRIHRSAASHRSLCKRETPRAK